MAAYGKTPHEVRRVRGDPALQFWTLAIAVDVVSSCCLHAVSAGSPATQGRQSRKTETWHKRAREARTQLCDHDVT